MTDKPVPFIDRGDGRADYMAMVAGNGGRPTTFTPERAAHIIHLVSNEGLSVLKASDKAGINRATLYRWRKAHPDFDEALATAMELQIDASLEDADTNLESAVDSDEMRRWNMLARNRQWMAEKRHAAYRDNFARDAVAGLGALLDAMRGPVNTSPVLDGTAEDATIVDDDAAPHRLTEGDT